MKSLTLIAASLVICLSGAAQPGGDVNIETIEKYNAKQEKKLKKILGDDLYNQWRAKHPQERPKLPDVELQ